MRISTVTMTIVLCVFLIGTSQQALAGAVYVAQNGNCHDNTPCVATVQEGVDLATAGDTVHVYPGTYDKTTFTFEKLIITTPLTLIAVAPGAILQTDGIEVLADDVTISGFKLAAQAAGGIFVGAVSGGCSSPIPVARTVIENNEVKNASDSNGGQHGGITVCGSHHVTIRDNVMRFASIRIWDTDNSVVEDNVYVASATANGPSAEEMTNVAIWLARADNNLIRNNVIRNAGTGILVYDSSAYNTVEMNRVQHTWQDGIQVTAANSSSSAGTPTNNIIRLNSVKNCVGVDVKDEEDPIDGCTNNTWSDNSFKTQSGCATD